MTNDTSVSLRDEKIGKLLLQQAVPASMGFFIMAIYSIVDTFFVGRWVGPLGIAGISIVTPIGFLIGSIGMSIGVGGSSIISRSLGGGNKELAQKAFANQVILTLGLSVLIVSLFFFLQEEFLLFFGAKGDILPFASDYFSIQLLGIPLLTWAMMSNNVIRAQGKSKLAMYTLVIPAIANVILDPIFIYYLDMGIKGASWATVIGYLLSALYTLYFFISKHNEIRIDFSDLKISLKISKEIFAIGGVSMVRQMSINLLMIILNNILFKLGGELAVTSYGLVNRIMLFVIFPILGIVQGILPIAGYNYGAKEYQRVKEVVRVAVSGILILLVIDVLIFLFSHHVLSWFTTDQQLVQNSSSAMTMIFVALPLLTIQMVASAYFQSLGRAFPALAIALLKPLVFMIPLVLLLPIFWGLEGVWYSFPLAECLTCLVSFGFLFKSMKNLK